MSATGLPPIRLAHDRAREHARLAIDSAPDGWIVRVTPPTRSLEQNAALHAALSELAKQARWHDEKLPMEVWKRLCVAAWLRETGESPRLIPALDGHGVDIIYEPTSQLTVAQCSSLLDWVYAFGAGRGVAFSDRPHK